VLVAVLGERGWDLQVAPTTTATQRPGQQPPTKIRIKIKKVASIEHKRHKYDIHTIKRDEHAHFTVERCI
jgi:hypothetical protein